jgi:CRP/FNR family cyclic AMP-dependent transcriptional regulator
MALRKNESAFITMKNNTFLNTILENMPDYVQDLASFEEISEDTPIVRTSYPVTDAFVILEGELVVVNEFESGKVYEPVTISYDDFVGVVEVVLNREEFISTVVATSKVKYIKIPKDIFKKWLKDNALISYLVLESVAKNFSMNMTFAGEQILLDSMYLLVNHIVNFSKYDEQKKMFYLQETREKTAKRTGINIRTLYRYLKKLKRLNYIFMDKKRISFDKSMKEKLIDYSILLRNK